MRFFSVDDTNVSKVISKRFETNEVSREKICLDQGMSSFFLLVRFSQIDKSCLGSLLRAVLIVVKPERDRSPTGEIM